MLRMITSRAQAKPTKTDQKQAKPSLLTDDITSQRERVELICILMNTHHIDSQVVTFCFLLAVSIDQSQSSAQFVAK